MRAEYLAAVLADSPVVFWEGQDSSGGMADSIGSNDLSTVTGTPDFGYPGPMSDSGIRFAGGENVSRTGVVSTVTDNLTMELLIFPEISGDITQQLFYNGNGGSNGWGIFTSTVSADFRFSYLCGGVAFGGRSNVAPTTDEWNHLVVKRTSGTWSYWLNGVVDTANAGTSAPNTPSGNTTVHGGVSCQAAYSYVALYETALSLRSASKRTSLRLPQSQLHRNPWLCVQPRS